MCCRLEKRLHEHNNDAQAEAVELRKQLRESMAVAEQLRRQIRITSKDNNQKYRSYEFKEAVAVPWDGGGRQSKQVYIDVLTTSEDGRAVQGNNAMIRFFNAVLMDGRAVSFAEEKGVRIDLIDHFDIGSRGLNAWLCFLHNFFPAHSTQAILRDGLKGRVCSCAFRCMQPAVREQHQAVCAMSSAMVHETHNRTMVI